MPTNTKGYWNRKRPNGKTNYEHYLWSKKKISERSTRNKARRKIWLKVGDPREVDHKRGVKAGNGKSNLRVISRKTNRRLGAKRATAVKKRK